MATRTRCVLGGVLEFLLIALLVYTLVFTAFAVLPVDPARSMLGSLASQDAVDELNKQYGFDRPIFERYARTLFSFAKGDFGDSVYYGMPASDIIVTAMPLTLARMFAAILLGCTLGAVGMMSIATHRVRWGVFVFSATYSIPAFSLMVCVLLVTVRFAGVAPSGNRLLFEALTVLCASFYALGATGVYLSKRLDLTNQRSRHADFLLLLRAPARDAVKLLFRPALPGFLSVTANAATTVLTAVTFAEFVFDLPGFSVIFIRSCERGDMSVVALGSSILAVILLMLQKMAGVFSRAADARLRR
ncbi:MAG: ABC transporter permease [Planctomycetota bacterium]|nr:ABC transporter permease [Planctomycetota bacterium]